jgi:hypothetical protein
VLRSGTSCCQGCGDDDVAINPSGEPELEQLVCGTVACGHCLPVYTDLGVDCTATVTDRSEADQDLLPAPRCVVVSTDTNCTPAAPCTL